MGAGAGHKMLADNSGSHSFAACAPFYGWHAPPPPLPRPMTLAKLNGVCLWIFEELENYCAWCQYNYVTQLIYTHLHVQYIDIFFITGNNSNFCTFENHIFRIDIISLASPPFIPVGSRVLNQPVHGVV